MDDVFTEQAKKQWIARMTCIYFALRECENTSSELVAQCNAYLHENFRFKNTVQMREFAHLHLPAECIRKNGKRYTYRLRNTVRIDELVRAIEDFGDNLPVCLEARLSLCCVLMATTLAYQSALESALTSGAVVMNNNVLSVSKQQEARNG